MQKPLFKKKKKKTKKTYFYGEVSLDVNQLLILKQRNISLKLEGFVANMNLFSKH